MSTGAPRASLAKLIDRFGSWDLVAFALSERVEVLLRVYAGEPPTAALAGRIASLLQSDGQQHEPAETKQK